ncbi:MAG: nitrilase family protein [Candidatus Competibacterales bacterium]
MSATQSPAEAGVTIACAQFEPHIAHKAANIAKTVALLEQAAERGARLVVMPELCNSGYCFQSRAEAFSLAETAHGGETIEAWAAAAKRFDLYLVAGFAEREGPMLYNSAALVGPQGLEGVYRKAHLWNNENLYFEPGDRGFPVFQTPLGRIAMLICYDCWFPEAWRLCALQGADVVCVPTNWVPIPGQDPNREAMANLLCMAAAHSNSIFIAAADRVGTERNQPFVGQSLIISYTGWPVAGPASFDGEELLVANVNLAEARRRRNWNDFNQILRDRRTDLYDEMVGADADPHWY